jgi:AraC-like DNA-binding protein
VECVIAILTIPLIKGRVTCMKYLTKEQVIATLSKHLTRAGTQIRLAQEIGVSPQYLNDMLRGAREPGKKVLRFLGLERHRVYSEKP